MKYPHRH